MMYLGKMVFVEFVRRTKECLELGIDMEYQFRNWFGTEEINHPFPAYCIFVGEMLEKIFDERIVSDWIYDDIIFDENGGFELTAEYNCGQIKTFYIKDEADLYDYIVWKSRQKNHIDCCGGTTNVTVHTFKKED